MGYDYERELAAHITSERRRLNNTNKLESDQAWRLYSFGSASCAYGSYEMALEAYAEYKNNCDW
jgi:hypothetical protein